MAFDVIRAILLKIVRRLELAGYDDFSIEDYFRKQGARIGTDNRIMVRYLGESPYLVTIGNHCTISSEVAFVTHDGASWVFTQEIPGLQKFGPIQILDNCFIGARSTLLPNIKIGPNSVVGICSVVTKSVPPNTVVAGNPARVLGPIDALKEKNLNIWEGQKPPGYLADLREGQHYSPRQIEMAKRRDRTILEAHLRRIFYI